MADKSDLTLFSDYLNVCCGTKERAILPQSNPFETYDDEKFKWLEGVSAHPLRNR